MLRREFWIKFTKSFKDIIFPLYCLGCGIEGFVICVECAKKLPATGVLCCPVCHAVNNNGSPCETCRMSTKLDQHIAIMPYREQDLIGKVVHVFKYQFVTDIMTVLEPIIKEFCQNHSLYFHNSAMIIPVPLHRRRFAERGFNQAELIAKALSRSLSVPLLSALRRQKQTKQQAKLMKVERETNVSSAFLVSDRIDIEGKEVVIVDDVYTTGSTIQECAAVLRAAGAKRVMGFTVARG